MTPYAPKSGIAGDIGQKIEAATAEFYAKHGITTQIVKEEKGFVLKAFKNGEYIGGLQQIADAIK